MCVGGGLGPPRNREGGTGPRRGGCQGAGGGGGACRRPGPQEAGTLRHSTCHGISAGGMIWWHQGAREGRGAGLRSRAAPQPRTPWRGVAQSIILHRPLLLSLLPWSAHPFSVPRLLAHRPCSKGPEWGPKFGSRREGKPCCREAPQEVGLRRARPADTHAVMGAHGSVLSWTDGHVHLIFEML